MADSASLVQHVHLQTPQRVRLLSPHEGIAMKCFLSHSSKDKKTYVALVAERLLPNISYDELTFEEGMGNLEEIISGIAESEIFVLFLSDHSLNSDWVKREISEAQVSIASGAIKRFFPIVIDPTIRYSDKRIPDWIRDNYNLRPITRPTIAAKRLKQRMVELSWTQHPLMKKRQEIFVGRNEILDDCELRFDDVNKRMPLAVFASGLRNIGRKTTILRALNKSSIIRPSYEPIRISLNADDGLDEFILRLSDTGLVSADAGINFLATDVKSKVRLAAQMLHEIQSAAEIILIEDGKCIVREVCT